MIFANTKSRPPTRIERLALRLSQFDYEIVHKPGETNTFDYFSRHPSKGTKNEFLEEVRASIEAVKYINAISASKLPRSITIEAISDASRIDPELQELLKLIG